MIATATMATFAMVAPFSGGPLPGQDVDSYRVRVDARPGSPEIWTVSAPENVRMSLLGTRTTLLVRRGGTEMAERSEGVDGSVLRNVFAAQPDGYPGSSHRYADSVAAVLAEAREGTRVLDATRLGGRPALRTDVALPANDCAGEPPRTLRLWLSPATLLPLRAVERARSTGKLLRGVVYTYSDVNARFPASAFAPPPLGPRPFRANRGFIRTAPAHAAGPLPYTPKLPTVLPPGFKLAVSGWARRSGITGAEGSIPPSAWLFAASYRRGQERVDVTQRVSGTDWPLSPFSGECQPLTEEPVAISGVPATFGIGATTVPHLFWRDGPLRYTVSGPFPKHDLVTIAESLRALGT